MSASSLGFRIICVADPCRTCACCLDLQEFICVPALLGLDGLDSLVSFPPSSSDTPFASSSTEFSEPQGGRLDGDLSFKAE